MSATATLTNTAVVAPMMMSAPTKADAVLDLIKARRSYYGLSKDLIISPARIQEIVKEALLHVPSSFNSQTNRVVVLFGAEHEKLWDMTEEALKPIVPADKWEANSNKMAMFRNSAGTVLFFEDEAVVQALQAKFLSYAEHFPGWAVQSDGMLQLVVWTALEAEGLGANLQHYGNVVGDRVAEEWRIPATWKLNAQLTFGGRTAVPNAKTFEPLENRFKVFGA